MQAPWWFGPLYGFDHGLAVAIRVRGLTGESFERTARCLRQKLRARGADAEIENADRPDPPVELIDGNSGESVLVPPRNDLPEPVWLDMNGFPIQPQP